MVRYQLSTAEVNMGGFRLILSVVYGTIFGYTVAGCQLIVMEFVIE